MPKEWGAPVLCDFGSAVPGDAEHSEDIQPNIYRAPEVIIEAPWSYSADIWNVGCMVSQKTLGCAVSQFLTPSQIWSIFENEPLFTGHDPELRTYRSRAHIAEMVSLLGPPPRDLVARGRLSDKFFTNKGEQWSLTLRKQLVYLHYFIIEATSALKCQYQITFHSKIGRRLSKEKIRPGS